MAATAVTAATSIMFWARARMMRTRYEIVSELLDKERQVTANLERNLEAINLAAADRKRRLSENGRKGRALQLAKAAQPDPERDAARAKTLSAFSATPMRSRSQVVAPVKAARTRAKKSTGAGMAAKERG
jgi:hypothetical protein